MTSRRHGPPRSARAALQVSQLALPRRHARSRKFNFVGERCANGTFAYRSRLRPFLEHDRPSADDGGPSALVVIPVVLRFVVLNKAIRRSALKHVLPALASPATLNRRAKPPLQTQLAAFAQGSQ
jgi:hypothetical protein